MKSIIIGAGTYGEVYLSYLKESGISVIGFLDDNKALVGKEINGVPVLGSVDSLQQNKGIWDVEAVYSPIGNNKLRVKFLELARSLGYKTPNFIHHDVKIGPDVTIAPEGVYILPNVVIMPHANIESDVMICTSANIAHHSRLQQGTFISTGVNFGANIISKKYAYIGIGATIMTGVKELGEDCLIGAGSVVIRDVPNHTVVAGIPAKIIREKEQ